MMPAATQGWNNSRYQSMWVARARAPGFAPEMIAETDSFTLWNACQ